MQVKVVDLSKDSKTFIKKKTLPVAVKTPSAKKKAKTKKKSRRYI